MRENERIADLTRRAYFGGAWYGPSVREALEGVDARQALERPVGAAHSIWEIALHISGWTEVVRRRLDGIEAGEPDEGDWPEPAEASDEAWRGALATLEERATALVAAAAAFDVSHLDEPLAPGGGSAYANLLGAVQHAVYHAGQIAVLKKA